MDRFLQPAAGPAGTVHCSIPDWSRFTALHLAAAQGKAKFLRPSTFRVLQTPPPGCDYACGWHVAEHTWAGGRVLYHTGTNNAWWSMLVPAPARDLAIQVATNQSDGVAETACLKAVFALIESLDLPADVFAPP